MPTAPATAPVISGTATPGSTKATVGSQQPAAAATAPVGGKFSFHDVISAGGVPTSARFVGKMSKAAAGKTEQTGRGYDKDLAKFDGANISFTKNIISVSSKGFFVKLNSVDISLFFLAPRLLARGTLGARQPSTPRTARSAPWFHPGTLYRPSEE